MEFINNHPMDTRIELKGKNLIGEIDFMHSDIIKLYPVHPDVASVMAVETSIFTTDTDGNTVEAETTLIINIHNYEQNLDILKIYGLFCYGTIFNYMTIKNTILQNDIKHDDSIYIPTVIIPSFQTMEQQIIEEMKRAYTDS